ncbi:hypothetical protein SAMN05660862_3598 [Sphingobacterium psychroaquaticum]|uniref:Polyketide cyclase / dehydrase and lipid transport n=2 Tax=Sphingobacterium psychroaquaticum TaxID=561061 RepID=A0A1X7L4Q3_9SPHI|nr:hypothetical protein SAMN05660862_3598 [Sphingobacterium psychroaquaticum]
MLLLLSQQESYAQMAAAKKVNWDVEHKVSLNATSGYVWNIIKDDKLSTKASNGFVKSITIDDATMPIDRTVYFADGTKRGERVTQMEDQHKLMVIHVAKESLDPGIDDLEIAIFNQANDADTVTELTWRILIKGDKEAKEKAKAKILTELKQYELGIQKMVPSKSIPAMRMQ